MAESKHVHPPVTPTKSDQVEKRKVIGIYGIPGCGKTFLLNLLKQKLDSNLFVFYEGSQLIASVVPGGLAAFQALQEKDKAHWRRLAINSVAMDGAVDKRAVVIVGHYMFWKDGDELGTPVVTPADLEIYTHILYLDVPAEAIVKRRQNDVSRMRPKESVSHLNKWQQREKADLRCLCYDHDILFSVVTEGPGLLDQMIMLLHDFQGHTEASNRSLTRSELDNIFANNDHELKTLLFIDADKTLAPVDTGELFWKTVSEMWPLKAFEDPLKAIFSSNMKYTHNAFRQAMLLYEETVDHELFDDVCKAVASVTIMYPDFVSLLQCVADRDSVGAVIITCGLRQIWEEVLKRQGLSNKIKVIGGGRLANGYVVTSETKTDLVLHAEQVYKANVWAFGDSPLDLGC